MPFKYFTKMPEKAKKLDSQERKSLRQKTIERYHNGIKNAQGRKAKKMARKKLRKYLKK